MHPMFNFAEVVYEEVAYAAAHPEHAALIFAAAGADIQEALTKGQSVGRRISDVGRPSLEQWAKINGELDIRENPQAILTRMQPGTLMGAHVAQYFKAAMIRRGIACELERTVSYHGMSGHIDIVLPGHRHLYEHKMTNSLKIEPPRDTYVLQAGMYANALEIETGDAWTASVVITQLPLRDEQLRLVEHVIDDIDFYDNAVLEVERIVRASEAAVPPICDVDKRNEWRCKLSCRYGACARNRNPMKHAA